MASPRAATVILLSILAIHLLHPVRASSETAVRSQATAAGINCGRACAVRCGRSWKPKMCLRMCNVCCGRCGCVPPGTGVETRALCPCYANMKNPKGKYKCP